MYVLRSISLHGLFFLFENENEKKRRRTVPDIWCSFLNAVLMSAHSLRITARSSAAVFEARTFRINSLKRIDMFF